MTHDYDNDGFGGSPHTSNAFEAYKAKEDAAWADCHKANFEEYAQKLEEEIAALRSSKSALIKAMHNIYNAGGSMGTDRDIMERMRKFADEALKQHHPERAAALSMLAKS